ncbi:flap endonuclease GEN [Condylostylus longicornis]|uniref:flap endonuclease GEN n=1 Tax=Condylostylus longicornis TaxID=2530218 RepID=UPI00244E2CAD|nr:flap endonuclease GEN [Condylostylus longicornis]
MGIKELWPLLTPYCERKPISVLRGKIVAIDLAGWVCESLNVVDYFIHPKHYLKNLFFRTCYMLLEDIIPVFILEGKAPELKAKAMKQRNEIQFRGVKPKDKNENLENRKRNTRNDEFKGRTQFNYVLKNCESLLNCMGIVCVQAPGEAEAYAAFLNKKGLVEGIISQDSDCFAYGATKVYRNFSVSTQGATSTQGGSVDIYDMEIICSKIDFGQEKVIAMALFCGCDYTDGINGVGKYSVLKLFKKYPNREVLDRIKSWRFNNTSYSEMEIRVNDKNICSNCGHIGKTITHSKSGCSICMTLKGCRETNWKEEKLIIKAELTLRQKALQYPDFPSLEIINEFLSTPNVIPNLNLKWCKPNLIKFIKTSGKLLQWTEIYCFQKFLPILTRWQIQEMKKNSEFKDQILLPDFIVKKRVIKGQPGYEIVWKDIQQLFEGLIPEDQILSYCVENPQGMQAVWTTIEPADLLSTVYPEIIDVFLKSKEKPKKPPTTRVNRKKKNADKNLMDMSQLAEITDQIKFKTKRTTNKRKGLQLIDKFFHKTSVSDPLESKNSNSINCSTPKKKLSLMDLEYECSYGENDISDIIKNIISHPYDKQHALQNYNRNNLIYEKINFDYSHNMSKDDLHILPTKIMRKNDSLSKNCLTKSFSLDDMSIIEISYNNQDLSNKTNPVNEISYFFEQIDTNIDEFEKSLANIE